MASDVLQIRVAFKMIMMIIWRENFSFLFSSSSTYSKFSIFHSNPASNPAAAPSPSRSKSAPCSPFPNARKRPLSFSIHITTLKLLACFSAAISRFCSFLSHSMRAAVGPVIRPRSLRCQISG